jgi:lysophospholipase L1-like esterase
VTSPAEDSGFEFSNLSGGAPSRFLRILRRLSVGVDKVENQIAPYAAFWHEHNIEALASTDPLWIVLGDSLSQGIGASSVERGWVLQAWRTLADKGIHYRVINLSFSGARITDVIEREIPALKGLATQPALVTVLIGSNDVIHRDLRLALSTNYAALVAILPTGSLVGVTEHPRGSLADINRIVEAAATTGAIEAVIVRFGSNKRAEDHFHPNDEGYALIAADFATAITRRHD